MTEHKQIHGQITMFLRLNMKEQEHDAVFNKAEGQGKAFILTTP